MIDKIEDALGRLSGVSIILWFVVHLVKVLTTPWMWASVDKSAETVMGIFIVLICPASLFLYITFDGMAETYDDNGK